jgi:hypothetical protein
MAHTYNPSNSEGRDQEDSRSKPAWANSLRDLISKTPITKIKRAGGVTQGVGPEFKPQYGKKGMLMLLFLKLSPPWSNSTSLSLLEQPGTLQFPHTSELCHTHLCF